MCAKRFAERVAQLVLEHVLPSGVMKFREDQSDSEYDFDLFYPSGEKAAVEVTESTVQDSKWIDAKIRKEGGSVIEAKHCKKSWSVLPTNDARTIPLIRKRVDEYLARIEQAGCEDFHCLDAWWARQEREAGAGTRLPPRVPRCVEDICYDLSVRRGWVVSGTTPPRISIKHPVGGSAFNTTTAIEAAERELLKNDNRKKLGAATTAERHLVVCVDGMNGSAWTALTEFQPPPELPRLPSEITHIWLIGYDGEINKRSAFVVWRASKTAQWQSSRHQIPSVLATAV